MRKTVLITGASRGIGRATAELFSSKGYSVVINYLYSQASAQELAGSLENRGGDVLLCKADIGCRREVDRMVEKTLKTFGGIDVLVNNAGIARQSLFTDLTEEDWDEMFRINLKGAFHCCQAVLPGMIHRKRGKIINISSIWGITGASCEVAYSSAKAGVIGFTKALAKELGPSQIQVNCVAPGIIDTEMNAALSEEDRASLVEETPLMRFGVPEDIARAIFFLASEQSDFITGQVLSPNGGYVI